MKKQWQASSLLTALMLISTALILLLFGKEKWLDQEKLSISYYEKYLSAKLALKQRLADDRCAELQQEVISEHIGSITYHYACQKTGLFIQPKPTKEKYIAVQNIQDWLDVEKYAKEIIYIQSLNELPQNQESDPKIVIAQNAIDERLNHHFYGIIITDHYFDIKGTGKVFGTLYSTFDNEREERNLTFRKRVIDNLERQYQTWHRLPHSASTLPYD